MTTINKWIGLALLLFAVSACTDDFEEINTDPNEPTSVPSENLLTQGQFALADTYWSRGMNFEFGMLMVQHFAQNEYAEESRYNQTTADFNGEWISFYAGGLSDINQAMELLPNESGTEASKANKMAMLKIMRAWAFQNMTDIWGDIPYTEAFQPDEFPNPAYDAQENIYPALVAEIDEALGMIDTSVPGYTTGDVIFGGNMMAWEKFANSLKLRMGMRMIDADPGLASTVVQEAANANLITANADNALFTFGTDQRIANPFFVDAITRDDFCVSQTLVEAMRAANDPRLSVYAKPNPNGEIQGMPYGLTDAGAFELKAVSSRPTDRLRQADAPAVLMSSAEVHFFLAEAAERGIVGGDAETLYNGGVAESMRYWGLTDQAAIDAYLSANPYNGMESIAYEKWVSLYSNGVEAWAEHRRLDMPELQVPDAAVIPQIPVRAFYPADEGGVNSSFAAVGFNDMTTNVWWDAN